LEIAKTIERLSRQAVELSGVAFSTLGFLGERDMTLRPADSDGCVTAAVARPVGQAGIARIDFRIRGPVVARGPWGNREGATDTIGTSRGMSGPIGGGRAGRVPRFVVSVLENEIRGDDDDRPGNLFWSRMVDHCITNGELSPDRAPLPD
jgi:hypothetical protein